MTVDVEWLLWPLLYPGFACCIARDFTHAAWCTAHNILTCWCCCNLLYYRMLGGFCCSLHFIPAQPNLRSSALQPGNREQAQNRN